MPQQIIAFREAGMQDHLCKPFARHELIAAVERNAGAGEPVVGPNPLQTRCFDEHTYEELAQLLGPEKMAEQLERFAAQLAQFTLDGDGSDRRGCLHRDAHRMVSSAGMLGFAELSSCCQALERALDAGGEVHAFVSDALAARERALERIGSLVPTDGPPIAAER